MQRPRSMYLVVVQSWGLVERKAGVVSEAVGPSFSRVSEWYLLEISVCI